MRSGEGSHQYAIRNIQYEYETSNSASVRSSSYNEVGGTNTLLEIYNTKLVT
jgi:hypothetical protein